MTKEILAFINEFSKFGKQVVDTFTNGCCYWFAHILKERFKEHGAEIHLLPVENHFVTKINGRLYDITGNVTTKYKNSKIVSWSTYCLMDPTHAQRITAYCITKTNQ